MGEFDKEEHGDFRLGSDALCGDEVALSCPLHKVQEAAGVALCSSYGVKRCQWEVKAEPRCAGECCFVLRSSKASKPNCAPKQNTNHTNTQSKGKGAGVGVQVYLHEHSKVNAPQAHISKPIAVYVYVYVCVCVCDL